MKKRHLLIIGLGIISLFSCEKKYVCTCTQVVTTPAYTYNGQYHPETIDNHQPIYNIYKSKKKDAEPPCKRAESFQTYSSTYAQYGQAPTTAITTCEVTPFD